jgi:hypothetical protein
VSVFPERDLDPDDPCACACHDDAQDAWIEDHCADCMDADPYDRDLMEKEAERGE